MKLLITGANGFLGKNLAEYYESKGNEVIKWTRRDNLLNSFEQNPDVVIHTAAEIYEPDDMFASNIMLTNNVLVLSRNYGVKKLMLLGSSSEYGRKNLPMSETDVLEPTNMYEGTKAAATLLAQGFANECGLQTTVVRPFTIVGRYEKPHKFFPTLYRKWKLDEELELAPGYHDVVFIDEFLGIFDKILNYQETKKFNIVNIGSGIQWSNNEIVSWFEDLLVYKYKIKQVPQMRSFDSCNWVSNSDSMRKYFTFEDNIMYSYFADGIERFINDCERLGLYV